MTQWHARRAELVNNLVRLYESASPTARADGALWYPRARAIVDEWSAHYGVPRNTVAMVIAALSPQVEWSRNLIMSDDVLAQRPLSVRGAFIRNEMKARQIREDRSEHLSTLMTLFPQGPKVNSFAWNLAGHDTIVTVDTHAVQAALDDPTTTVTLRWAPYKVFAECYATAAARVGLSAAAFQAVCWLAWKERYPRMRKHALRKRW